MRKKKRTLLVGFLVTLAVAFFLIRTVEAVAGVYYCRVGGRLYKRMPIIVTDYEIASAHPPSPLTRKYLDDYLK